jgi:hypothetical protein
VLQGLIEERKPRPDNTEKRLKIPWKRQIEKQKRMEATSSQHAIINLPKHGEFDEG